MVAVLLVNFAISDGRTNYLEGFVMMMAYVCIALVCWYVDDISLLQPWEVACADQQVLQPSPLSSAYANRLDVIDEEASKG